MSGLLKLMFPDPEADIPDDAVAWAARLAGMPPQGQGATKAHRGCRIPQPHFSFTMCPDGIEQFVSTPELHNENSDDHSCRSGVGCLPTAWVKSRAVPH